jgi:hypothetical protein
VKTSGKKIGADELPAVTQLFTEDYMVLFLLENTLGAWWAGKVLAAHPALAAGAASEGELREKTSPSGYRWTYLRFAREPREGETQETATGPWRPAAGAFDGWPKAAKEITVLDPCMGSGHFLVFALPILVALRGAEEGLDERAAVKAVLAENLFGLEIDPRCTQIAAFALALASWKRLGGPEPLPRLNFACSGLAIGLGKMDFLKLAERIADVEGWTAKADLLWVDRTPLGATATATHRGELEALYDLFKQAPWLGSLIDTRQALERAFGPLYATGIDKLGAVVERLLESRETSVELRETAVTAQGLAKAAQLLGQQYTLVATNVPYLKRGKQTAETQQYCARFFELTEGNLGAALVERCLRFCKPEGTAAPVIFNEFLNLTGYAGARRQFLKKHQWHLVARLGAGAFETISGEVVNVALLEISNANPGSHHMVFAWDTSKANTPSEKGHALQEDSPTPIAQRDQLNNPDARVVTEQLSTGEILSARVRFGKGRTTGDSPHYHRFFWEYVSIADNHVPWLDDPKEGDRWSGRSLILNVRLDDPNLETEAGLMIRGQDVWGSNGVAINKTGRLVPFAYAGEIFDDNIGVLKPNDPDVLSAVAAFVEDPAYSAEIRKVDQTLKVTAATLAKVPFDSDHWQQVAAKKYPSGLPKPHSNDPIQWLFDGHPRGSADPNITPESSTDPRLVTPRGVRPGVAEHPLQLAVARLLGCRWPRQTGSSFMDCPAVSEPDEVDRSGLVDTGGIVPLPALAGEADAATRLRDLIRAVWGADYGEGTIRELLAAEEAKTTDLGTWLADEFFDGHCRLFHQTPFIWHIWDGLRSGFSALLNYHRLCEGNGAARRLLEKLRDSYLGEWIAAQRRGLAAGEAGAEERLIAAEHLRGELSKIIEGEPPYDIFVRWKPLHRQPIGWEPDIDDGVRLNIRPFLTAKPKNSGRRDGCILRVTPRVKKHAGADRGAEPDRGKDGFPWFWAEDDDVATENFAGGPQFKGRRYNDFHYTRAFKQRGRDAKVAILKGVA